jgi:hypothetical protein
VVVAQGDVFWADLPEPTGSGPGLRRSVLIVQGNAFNRSRIEVANRVGYDAEAALSSVQALDRRGAGRVSQNVGSSGRRGSWSGRSRLTRSRKDGDFLPQPIAEPVPFDLQVVSRLQVQPEPLRGAEEARKTKCRVCRDGALSMDDLVDASRRNVDLVGKPILRQPQGTEELFQEHFPRMNRRQLLRSHRSSSVVVDDLDLMCVAAPPLETDPPLVIDPNAVLTRTLRRKLLEPIPGWYSKIVEGLSGVEHDEFSQSDLLQTSRKPT